MVRALTTKEFIAKAIRVHGNRYNYSKVFYENNKTEVRITCPVHGDYWQLPRVHFMGHGCQACFGGIQKTGEQFIRDARKIHGEKYNYSKVKYINNYTKIIIICLKHGEFKQTPNHHINDKNDCPRCVKSGYSKISIQFLNDLAKEWKVDIQHAENGGEYRIEDSDFNCYYKADGYFELDNKKYVVEFHGNFFHGNPKIYKPDSICKLRRITFGELYKKTEERMYRIKALGYEVIFIWEQDYKQYLFDKDNEFIGSLFEYYKIL